MEAKEPTAKLAVQLSYQALLERGYDPEATKRKFIEVGADPEWFDEVDEKGKGDS